MTATGVHDDAGAFPRFDESLALLAAVELHHEVVHVTVTILLYLAYLRFGGTWNQTSSAPGVFWSVLTGICVGVGTIFFFVLFQKGGPLSAVPMILAGGAALMAVAGILLFKEPVTVARLAGIALALAGLFLLRSPTGN